MIVDIAYFRDIFKTDFDLETSTEHTMTFEKFSNIAEDFVLAICGIRNYVEADYEDYQIEALKKAICIWVEHWLTVGYDLTPTGTKSYQALGYNFSKTNPQDPEFVPRQIKYGLTRAGLFHSLLGFSVNDTKVNSGIDDTKLKLLEGDKE